MIIFIPIVLAMVFADDILSLWNDDQQFTSIAGEYCLYSIPGLFSASLYYALKGIDIPLLLITKCQIFFY